MNTPTPLPLADSTPAAGDTLSVLTHAVNPATKTWKTDGTIIAAQETKYFSLTEHHIDGIIDLSMLLHRLEHQPKACLIRGRYVGDDTAKARDAEDYQPGKVRRANDYFDDQPLHSVMIDIDGYQGTIEHFINNKLPAAWRDVSYHWQLSSSSGHPSKAEAGLRAHVWFWMASALTSAQLKAFAQSVDLPADMALFNPVQAHYTANPIFERGCKDPITARSGFEIGNADEVVLDVTPQVFEALPRAGSGQVLLEIAESDPIVRRLSERGMILGKLKDRYNIICPYEDEHTSESAPSSTQYLLPYTNGHAQGHFKCLHAHCVDRNRHEFIFSLGLDDTLDAFTDCSTHPDVILAVQEVTARVEKNTARFLLEDYAQFEIRTKGSWLIKNVLPNATLGVIYGASGSGKSFFALDLLGALAQGNAWNGNKTPKKKPVAWVAAEGQEDMRKRATAYRIRQGVQPSDIDMKFIAEAPNFLEKMDVEAVIKQLLAHGPKGTFAVIVIDTLAQVMPGGNENSGEDMGRVLAYCRAITRATGAMVILVHHSGKDESRGARGWSGLRAACDFELEIIRSDEDRVATITKLKGGQDGQEFGFRLEMVQVGVDEDGDPESTCVVQFTDSTKASVSQKAPPKGKGQAACLDQLETLQALGGPVTRNEFLLAVITVSPYVDSPTTTQARSHAIRDLKALIEQKRVAESDKGILEIV